MSRSQMYLKKIIMRLLKSMCCFRIRTNIF